MTREEIINNIRKEGLNIGKNDVLIGIMPTQIQSIVLAYHRYENYVPDFLITSFFSIENQRTLDNKSSSLHCSVRKTRVG